jgi:tetratricopeptide (TPR) repeat protein
MRKLTETDWAVMSEMRAHVERQEFEQALDAVVTVECHTADPRELATILLNKAQCCRVLGKFDEAHAACDRALDRSKGNDEDTVDGWIVKTDILIGERRWSDALSVIESSLRCYPELERAQQLLRKAELLGNLSKHAEVISVLRDLHEDSDFYEHQIAWIHHSLGVSYGETGEWDNAFQHLLKAECQHLPEVHRANNSLWLAHAAARQRDFLSAKAHLLNALAEAKHSNVDLWTDVYESLANVSRELGDEKEAARYGKLWKTSKENKT